jgi:hypothetical protein
VAGRTRTAKSLAQRIDLNYFKRPHPFRRWKLGLSIAVPAAALVWLGGMAAAGSRTPYSSGPVSSAHQVFGDRCERCHVTGARAFRAHVTDNMCLTCHDAPQHKSNQTFTPACATCHLEHRGPIRLSATAEGDCEQCHRNLGTTTGRLTVARVVGAFNEGHPEFAARQEGSKDPAVLKFNHEVHLKPDLRGPAGPTKLECATCHVPAAVPRTSGPVWTRRPPATAMLPVTYARNRASCHPLYVDPLIDRMAPHDAADKVQAMVAQALTAYISENPAQIGRPDPVRGRIPVNFPEPMPLVRTAGEWIAARTASVERMLWSKTCAECHTIERAPLRVVPTNVRSRWMPRARFEHAAHQLTNCTSCHPAGTSRETSDVLMPSIATCQQCHKPARGAESRCFECHEYHDWTNAKPATPGFDLNEIVKGAS